MTQLVCPRERDTLIPPLLIELSPIYPLWKK